MDCLVNNNDRCDLHAVYLEKAIAFLAKYSWIYNFKNTDIFVQKILEDIPDEWKEPLLSLSINELNQVPYGFIREEWPRSLQEFVSEAVKLTSDMEMCMSKGVCVDDIEVPAFIRRKMSIKKQKEVMHMAAVISTICQKHNCGTVLDLGSGLGYLNQVLHHNFGLTVIGIDCDAERSHGAESRVQEGLCKGNIHNFTYNVDSTFTSVQHIKNILRKAEHKTKCCCGTSMKGVRKLNECSGVIMIGLHSCGSLLPDMMKLFLQLPEVKLFFCVGCCYHRMNIKDFPLSNAGKMAIASAKINYPSWSPTLYGFRLGSQDTRSHWAARSMDDHELHIKNVAFRGILEYFIQLESLHWSRPKRRFSKLTLSSSFENYALLALGNMMWDDAEKREKLKKLSQIFQEQQPIFSYIRILALFQVLFQPIWEGVICQDRNIFFFENGIDSQLSKICDELISPRNLALYGIKK